MPIIGAGVGPFDYGNDKHIKTDKRNCSASVLARSDDSRDVFLRGGWFVDPDYDAEALGITRRRVKMRLLDHFIDN
jgi:hypothetical protein